MTQGTESAETRPEPPPLKVVEPKVNTDNPWADDALDRERIIKFLTEVVREQEAPFVISVHGRWGTGKTFLLKRWRQDLENQGFQAIYFNAWEDDFCDDPLLAIIGQLHESLGKGKFRRVVEKIVEVGKPLLRAGASITLTANTGISLPPDSQSSPPEDSYSDYRRKKEKKEELKGLLREMAGDIAENTEQPLVFIIDELDRCRPTFAIELLERIKHIFDVPNIVFVFGLNRGELVKSLQSAYGDIDAATYLRRFFDMHFSLPEPSAVQFCEHLVQKFGLNRFFRRWGRTQGSEIGVQVDLVAPVLPLLLGNMGLSLRDMDYCMRVLSLAVASDEHRASIDPYLLTALIAVKIRDPDLHRRFVEGNALGSEVIDYIDDLVREHQRTFADSEMYDEDGLDRIAAAIYCTDVRRVAWGQFQRAVAGSTLDRPEYLSKEHQRWIQEDTERMNRIAKVVDECTRMDTRFGLDLYTVTSLIDLPG